MFCSRLVLVCTQELFSLACCILRFSRLFFFLTKLISPFCTGLVGFSSMFFWSVLFVCFFFFFFFFNQPCSSQFAICCLFKIFFLFWSLHAHKIMIYFICLYVNGNIIHNTVHIFLAVVHVVSEQCKYSYLDYLEKYLDYKKIRILFEGIF